MPLSDIHVDCYDEYAESLTLALQALLRWAGCEADYASLNATLGLSFMISVRDPGRCLASWMTEGRDAFLAETAALSGVRLRELHPPEAAAGLERSPEFAQHFDASYKPLIERALENDEPVLAHRGWPGDAAARWGVITSRCDTGVGFCGTTNVLGGEPVPLVTPAVQAYVVEAIKPRVPPEPKLARVVLNHARIVLHNQTHRCFGLTTGPDVYAAWLERLRHEHVCAACGGASPRCYLRLACAVAYARQSAAAFLSNQRETFPPAARGTVDLIVEECRNIVQALPRRDDLTAVNAMLETESRRMKLADELDAIRNREIEVGRHIDGLRVAFNIS